MTDLSTNGAQQLKGYFSNNNDSNMLAAFRFFLYLCSTPTMFSTKCKIKISHKSQNIKTTPKMVTNSDINLYFCRDSLRSSVVLFSVWVILLVVMDMFNLHIILYTSFQVMEGTRMQGPTPITMCVIVSITTCSSPYVKYNVTNCEKSIGQYRTYKVIWYARYSFNLLGVLQIFS